MSLIVVRKNITNIYIVSDTKLTCPDDIEFSKRQKIDPKEGVIKTIIINEFSCISFAGNIEYADAALKETGLETDTDNILSILLCYNKKSAGTTNFIFCTGQPYPLIFEIRNSEVRNVNSSWIGSKRGFEKFQSIMLGEDEVISEQISFSIKDSKGEELFSKMTKAIDSVIDDDNIPEVSGFKIRTYYDGGKFVYLGYFDSYLGGEEIWMNIPPGRSSFNMPIVHTASDGGYSVNFFSSSVNHEYVGLHIMQGNFGVVYSRKNKGLMYPELFKDMDELDFWDCVRAKYKISPIGITQNVVGKYGYLGDSCYKAGQIQDAYIWYNKGADYSHGKEKALFYYNKAICLLHLKRFSEAIFSFNEAIKLNGVYQKMATEIMKRAFGRGL